MQEEIKAKIRTVPHWPKAGVMFRDITTLLKDAVGFKMVIDGFYERYCSLKIDKVVGIESRGFIIGGALADRLNVGFVPIRKKGKLPAQIILEEYDLEYGHDVIEIHADALERGERVLLVDDLVATGGTALAAYNLIKRAGGELVEMGVVIDLPDLGGSKKLFDSGVPVFCLVEFAGK